MSKYLEGIVAQIRAYEGGLTTVRMKKNVMWEELTKLAVNLNGYEGQALVQLMDDYSAMKNDLCIKCGKYAEKDGCKDCRWRNEQ